MIQMGQLKSDRDRLARALSREVGDDVPLEKVLEEDSDWRGRAQQISLLRDKLREASLHQVCNLELQFIHPRWLLAATVRHA